MIVLSSFILLFAGIRENIVKSEKFMIFTIFSS